MKQIEGGICAVRGVSANGIKLGKMGIAVILAEGPAAGVFTKNKVTAAPVTLSKGVIDTHHRLSAVIVNSGNANACTGEAGLRDAHAMAAATAKALKISAEDVYVASTGRIGVRLPMANVKKGIFDAASKLETSETASAQVTEAMMTSELVALSAWILTSPSKSSPPALPLPLAPLAPLAPWEPPAVAVRVPVSSSALAFSR